MKYFEDLAVGDETYFGSYEVTREEVMGFAKKYDPQPFHLSDEHAAKTHFGRIAASGWHTSPMTMGVSARHGVQVRISHALGDGQGLAGEHRGPRAIRSRASSRSRCRSACSRTAALRPSRPGR